MIITKLLKYLIKSTGLLGNCPQKSATTSKTIPANISYLSKIQTTKKKGSNSASSTLQSILNLLITLPNKGSHKMGRGRPHSYLLVVTVWTDRNASFRCV
ncbi:MAG: hypothetical protein [Microviridae sp.]|nr:MAG: hypothetical protein [Microviridae sp.]